jgi:hypothetical protein
VDIQPITTEETTTASRRWLLSLHGSSTNKTVTLDLATLTADTHYAPAANMLPNRVYSGLPLGKITASGLYGLYDSAAVDGREVFAGLLATETAFNTGTTKVGGALIVHGDVDPELLPIEFTVPATASRSDSIHFS